jgi:hypothetical protein
MYIFSIYFAPPQRAAAALCRPARLARGVSAYFVFHKKDIATHQRLKAGVSDLGQRAARPQRTQWTLSY